MAESLLFLGPVVVARSGLQRLAASPASFRSLCQWAKIKQIASAYCSSAKFVQLYLRRPRPINQTTYPRTHPDRPTDRPTDPPTHPPTHQPTNQPTNQPVLPKKKLGNKELIHHAQLLTTSTLIETSVTAFASPMLASMASERLATLAVWHRGDVWSCAPGRRNACARLDAPSLCLRSCWTCWRRSFRWTQASSLRKDWACTNTLSAHLPEIGEARPLLCNQLTYQAQAKTWLPAPRHNTSTVSTVLPLCKHIQRRL